MNEVKELCEQALDGPEPPLRDTTEMLAVARRATRTRDLRRAASGLVAAAALAAGAALVAPAVTVTGAQPVPPATALSPSPPPAAAPTVERVVEHMPYVAELLAEALPDGYTIDRYLEQPAWHAELPGDSYVVTWMARVSSGAGTGALQVIVRGNRPGLTGNPCEPEISAGFAAPGEAWCWQGESDSGPIWIISGRDDSRGEVHAASRVLDGGYLTVVAQQAVEGDEAASPLARAPFTAADLAALVADPAMLPPNG